MNQAEARRRVWKRLATWARLQAENEDLYEAGLAADEFEHRRIEKAFVQVADSINRKLAKSKGAP